MNRSHSNKYKVLLISVVFFAIGCSTYKKDALKNRISVYKGACKHTQTFSSVILWNDSTIHFNAGAFLDNVAYDGKYEIIGDTIYLTWNDKDKEALGNRLENGLLIMENGIKELGDSSIHRHFFKYKWEKKDL